MSGTITAGESILGKYLIRELIGEGGMARVWLAEEIAFGKRLVAIKEPRSDLSPDEQAEMQSRFRKEVDVCAALEGVNAPYIVRAITAEPYAQQLLLVMAYMPGGDLAQRIASNKEGMPIDQVIEIAGNLLTALQAAHEHPMEIVHRDLKPSNVLFDSRGKAHLADFGVAQTVRTVMNTHLMGTPHPVSLPYMAPEQASNTGYLTPAADLFALGCILFEMVTGKRYKRMRPGTRASQVKEGVPAWLDDLLIRALVENPFDRYQSAGQMLEMLVGPKSALFLEAMPQEKANLWYPDLEVTLHWACPQVPVNQATMNYLLVEINQVNAASISVATVFIVHLSTNRDEVEAFIEKEIESHSIPCENFRVFSGASNDYLAPSCENGLNWLSSLATKNTVVQMAIIIDSEIIDEDAVLLQARRAGLLGIPISVFGLGHEWNSDFVDDVANLSYGLADHCETIESLHREINRYISNVCSSFVLCDSTLEFSTETSSKLATLCSVTPLIMKIMRVSHLSRSYYSYLGSPAISVNNSLAYILFLKLDSFDSGEQTIGSLRFTYSGPGRITRREILTDLKVSLLDLQSDKYEWNPALMNLVEKVMVVLSQATEGRRHG